MLRGSFGRWTFWKGKSESIRIRYKLISNRKEIQLLRIMAKKSSRKSAPKIRRTSSIQRCIEDGQDYLKNTKKRIIKTRAMVKKQAEAARISAPPKNVLPKKVKKRYPRKRISRPTRPAIPSRPALMFHGVPLPPVAIPGRLPAPKRMIALPKGAVFKPSNKSLPLPAFGFIDVCFCLDATGSMSSQLAQVQSTIANLIEKISNKVSTEGINLRFGVVAYRDHMDSNILETLDFTDPSSATRFVNKLRASGGGDEPEAAHDGLLTACKSLNWMNIHSTPMLRYIFHVLDAPPHGKQFTGYQAKNGCTCGISTDTIMDEMNMKQIHYRMIKVRNNPRVDKTEQIFKARLGNFDSVDISHAREMDVKVSDMVIHEIMPDI